MERGCGCWVSQVTALTLPTAATFWLPEWHQQPKNIPIGCGWERSAPSGIRKRVGMGEQWLWLLQMDGSCETQPGCGAFRRCALGSLVFLWVWGISFLLEFLYISMVFLCLFLFPLQAGSAWGRGETEAGVKRMQGQLLTSPAERRAPNSCF